MSIRSQGQLNHRLLQFCSISTEDENRTCSGAKGVSQCMYFIYFILVNAEVTEQHIEEVADTMMVCVLAGQLRA